MLKLEELELYGLVGGVTDDEKGLVIAPSESGPTLLASLSCAKASRTTVCFYLAGSVEVIKDNDVSAETHRLAVLVEGDTFGAIEFVDIQPRSASVRAL